MTKQLHQQAAFAAAASKKFIAVHIKVKSHKTKANSLDEALKLSWQEVDAVEKVVEEQRTRLEAIGIRRAEWKNPREEASACTATCRKGMLQMQKNLATTLEHE